MSLTSVDLPEPVWPTMAVTSPRGMERLTPSSAWRRTPWAVTSPA